MPSRTPIGRERWLAHRWRQHGLGGRLGTRQLDDLLLLGVQDGRQNAAVQALSQRLTSIGRTPVNSAIRVRGPLTVAWTFRTAPHAHRLAQLPVVRLALAAQELDDGGAAHVPALKQVSEVLRACAEEPIAKGELSTAVSTRVPRELTMWCGTCQAHHVPDGLFRAAAHQAALVLDPSADTTTLRPAVRGRTGSDGPGARTQILDVWLRVNGPVTKAGFGAWFGVGTRAAGALWADRTWVPVTVDGHNADLPEPLLDDVRNAPPAEGVRLVPPTDPYLRQVPKDWLVPDKARRAELFRPVGGPGALLVDGEVAGTWRFRKDGSRLTVSTFRRLPAARRDDAAGTVERFRTAVGADDVSAEWE